MPPRLCWSPSGVRRGLNSFLSVRAEPTSRHNGSGRTRQVLGPTHVRRLREQGREFPGKLQVRRSLGDAAAEDSRAPVASEYQVWMGLFVDGDGRRVCPSLSQLFVVTVN